MASLNAHLTSLEGITEKIDAALLAIQVSFKQLTGFEVSITKDDLCPMRELYFQASAADLAEAGSAPAKIVGIKMGNAKVTNCWILVILWLLTKE